MATREKDPADLYDERILGSRSGAALMRQKLEAQQREARRQKALARIEWERLLTDHKVHGILPSSRVVDVFREENPQHFLW